MSRKSKRLEQERRTRERHNYGSLGAARDTKLPHIAPKPEEASQILCFCPGSANHSRPAAPIPPTQRRLRVFVCMPFICGRRVSRRLCSGRTVYRDRAHGQGEIGNRSRGQPGLCAARLFQSRTTYQLDVRRDCSGFAQCQSNRDRLRRSLLHEEG
jgi:hypothetical protein